VRMTARLCEDDGKRLVKGKIRQRNIHIYKFTPHFKDGECLRLMMVNVVFFNGKTLF
jgi:hypothetical protein